MGDFMTLFKYIIFSIAILIAILILFFAFKSQKPIKLILFNWFLGITSLLILYLTRKYTGLNIAINQYSVLLSSILGLPAVLILLILNFIILV